MSLAISQLALGQSSRAETTPASPPANAPLKGDRYKNLELFQKVMSFVESNYVEKVNNDELIQGAIKGMLETLDPHSNFLPPELFKDMKIDTSGRFGGVGIEITLKDNVLTVVSPIEDSPAWHAGIKPDDRIVKIDGESTKGLTLSEAVAKMRGKKGSKIVLTIFRTGWEKFREVPVARETIKIQSVKRELVEAGYGYIRLNSFNENAATDVFEAIEKLEQEGKLKGLVFDLRMNPGGLLDQAVDVSSLFLKEGVIVSTAGRNSSSKEVRNVKPGPARVDLPLAVLVNSSTASAAEIVAGALQDHHRAIVMGQPTFGKGSVQTVIDLGSEMGLKLTIARYFTPSGRSIQEKGVIPDILLDDYDHRLLSKAKIKRESTREKDLKAHLVNKTVESSEEKENAKANEFTMKELERVKKKGNGENDAETDDDMVPLRFQPKDDFQVKEAINFLKSFDVYRRISSKQTESREPSSEAKRPGGADRGPPHSSLSK